MADFFDDPDHPDRPQHPDFHRLMDVVNYLDGEASEGNREPGDIAAETIDPDSLLYMAIQRAMRLNQQTGLPVAPTATIWFEAFLAGARFMEAGGHRED